MKNEGIREKRKKKKGWKGGWHEGGKRATGLISIHSPAGRLKIVLLSALSPRLPTLATGGGGQKSAATVNLLRRRVRATCGIVAEVH